MLLVQGQADAGGGKTVNGETKEEKKVPVASSVAKSFLETAYWG